MIKSVAYLLEKKIKNTISKSVKTFVNGWRKVEKTKREYFRNI